MKKFGVVLAIIVAIAFVGCGSTGGGGGGQPAGNGAAPYTVNLSGIKYIASFSNAVPHGPQVQGARTRNVTPLAAQYDGVLFVFPDLPASVAEYSRITIRAKYFNAAGAEIPQGNNRAMVVLIYDVTGDLKGPEQGTGRNTPLKQFNLGGGSSSISTDAGSALRITQAPGGVLVQNTDATVKFLELTAVIFHNGDLVTQ